MTLAADEVAVRLRRFGRKLTPQRHGVVQALGQLTGTHPTAATVTDAVRRHQPMVSVATVYKILNDLAQLGLLRTVDVGDGRTHYDLDTGLHAHAVCRRCGGILDVAVAAAPTVVLPPAADFAADQVEVTLRGLCGRCRASRTPPPDDPRTRAQHPEEE